MSGLKLKLNLKTSGIGNAPSLNTPSIPTPSTATATPGGSKPRLKLTNKSNPSTPAPVEAPKPKKTKAGRTAKPSAKLLENKKRPKEESDTDGEHDSGTISVQQPPKKIKLSIGGGGSKTPAPAPSKTPATPVILKAKVKPQVPKRAHGQGYDSEASDREIDPFMEEEFILRMPPGDDCDYLRKAIEEKRIGGPKGSGADVMIKFFDDECRRGVVVVKRNIYAATMVDLPCIIEGMKSWDRRGWWKAADICQMLWVFAPVQSEEQAKSIPLPDEVDQDTWQYPHGLTPPMHFVRKNRFRKRIHKTVIERVEDEVQKLMNKDAAARRTTYEIFDPEAVDRRASQFNESSPGYDHDDEEDAEGEDDEEGYFDHQPEPEIEMDPEEAAEMEAEMEAELEKEFLMDTLGEDTPAATPDIAGTPSVALPAEPEEDSGDESFDSEDDDGAAPSEIDEEEKARLAQIQGTREDIAELESKIEKAQHNLSIQKNPLLQKRLEEGLRKLKQEVQLKKSSIGEDEENE